MTKYDELVKRCPMLGHQINFKYCRSVSPQSPCRKILDCWFEQIPIQQYISENYDTEVINKLMIPPKPKILSILELVEQAKAVKQE
ncbi:hypothetical protein JXQ31_00185 [candidate division KSB1 bacterium]|nr:hypothetical protein [candidate division KSB1 bacterium]